MSFQKIIGHERPLRILQAALRRKRLAHAYLFQGDKGIGKQQVAKAFAKAANCLSLVSVPVTGESALTAASEFGNEPLLDACGTCRSCRTIEADTHPDYITLAPDGPLMKIGQIRALQEKVQLKPMIGPYRFILLDQAESMNAEAANALLKTLEEPPDQTILILITSRPNALPQTVLSRCQSIRFTPLADHQVLGLLQQRHPGNPDRLRRVAAMAMGRIGLALEFDPTSLEAEGIKFNKVLSEKGPRRMDNLLDLAYEYGRNRDNTEWALQWIGLWLRDLLVIKLRVPVPCVIAESASPDFSQIARKVSLEDIIALANLIHWIWKALARNLNRQLALEVLLLQIHNAIHQAHP